METIYALLPLALLIAGLALAFFVWAVRSGQYDDLETPPVRMLFDDDAPRPTARGVNPAAPAAASPEAAPARSDRP